jgi:hypothetical protein
MEEQKYTQQELLTIINQYNTLPRKIIKSNYKRILSEYNIQPKQIMDELGYGTSNVHCWSTKSSANIPMFPQALSIATAFDFDVQEFIK